MPFAMLAATLALGLLLALFVLIGTRRPASGVTRWGLGRLVPGVVYVREGQPWLPELLASEEKGSLPMALAGYGDFPFLSPELHDDAAQRRLTQAAAWLLDFVEWRRRVPAIMRRFVQEKDTTIQSWTYRDLAEIVLQVQHELLFRRPAQKAELATLFGAADAYDQAFSARRFRDARLLKTCCLQVLREARGNEWYRELVDTFHLSVQEAMTVVVCVWLFKPMIKICATVVPLLEHASDGGREARSKFARMARKGDMPYLHACVQEAVRLSPPVPVLCRKLAQPVGEGKVSLCAGATALVHLSRFPADGPFSPQAAVESPREGRLGFGAGPRACPGEDYSLTAIAQLLHCIFTEMGFDENTWKRLTVRHGFRGEPVPVKEPYRDEDDDSLKAYALWAGDNVRRVARRWSRWPKSSLAISWAFRVALSLVSVCRVAWGGPEVLRRGLKAAIA